MNDATRHDMWVSSLQALLSSESVYFFFGFLVTVLHIITLLVRQWAEVLSKHSHLDILDVIDAKCDS